MIARPLLVAGLAAAASAAIVSGTAAYTAKPHGYLADGAFDVVAVLPPAPIAGDPRYKADRKIFKLTRHMIGTPRYALATSDADYSTRAVMADFSCAAGATLTPQSAPRTMALVERAAVDTGHQTSAAKDFYKRRRPYFIDRGDICQPKSDLGNSYDYPSGHTTYGWTWALILSDLLPDRATAILARGRAYGDSRFICGAHNFSAVEGGKLAATATMQAVRATPAFQADEAAARVELATLRADPNAPKPAGCDDEAKLVAQRVL